MTAAQRGAGSITSLPKWVSLTWAITSMPPPWHAVGPTGRDRSRGQCRQPYAEPAASDRRDPHPARVEVPAVRGLVCHGPLDPHVEPVVGESLGQPLPPLDHGDGRIE